MSENAKQRCSTNRQLGESRVAGYVFITATPIGNLSDISERAVRTLSDADFIAAEDTRVTRKLLGHLGIKKPMLSYHAHNQNDAIDKILARVLAGENCAVVTDAGTPGISDPGGCELVRLCVENNIPVTAIPGPCAAITALTLSGLPVSRFVFEGFLPAVKGKRISRLQSLSKEPRTMVFYEAPHKLLRTLCDMRDVFGVRNVSISRELTKMFEETMRFTLSDAIAHFEANSPRGEFVIVVEGTGDASAGGCLEDALERAMVLIDEGCSVRDAINKAARIAGCSKNELYKLVLSSKAT